MTMKTAIAILALFAGVVLADRCNWGGIASQADDQDDEYQYCNETTGAKIIVDTRDEATLTVPLGVAGYGSCEVFEPGKTDAEILEEYDLAVRPFFKAQLFRDPADLTQGTVTIDQHGETTCGAAQRRVYLDFGQDSSQCTLAQTESLGVATEMYFKNLTECQAFAAQSQADIDQAALDAFFEIRNQLVDPFPALNQIAQSINPDLEYESDDNIRYASFTAPPNWDFDNVNCYGVGKFVSPPFHVPTIFQGQDSNWYLSNHISSPGPDDIGDGFLCRFNCNDAITQITQTQTDPRLWPVDFANSTCASFYNLMAAYNASNADVPNDHGLGAGNYALASLMLELWAPRPCGVCQPINPYGGQPVEGGVNSILGNIGTIFYGFTGVNAYPDSNSAARLQLCQRDVIMKAHFWIDPELTSEWDTGAYPTDCKQQPLGGVIKKEISGSATLTAEVTDNNEDLFEYNFCLAIRNLVNPTRSLSSMNVEHCSAEASYDEDDELTYVDYIIQFDESTDDSFRDSLSTLQNTDEDAFASALNSAFDAAGLDSTSVTESSVSGGTPDIVSPASTVTFGFALIIVVLAMLF